jgi:hypothetical protein
MAAHNLFEFNQQTGLVQLNREWVGLVPEFKEILTKSKGVKGDNDGRKKLHATRIFTFIYMLVDFKSPLRNMDGKEKYKQALRSAELEEADITAQVKEATAVYEMYQENSARSLRSLKSMRTSLDRADKYFEKVDFDERDKKGELVYSMAEYLNNMKKMDDVYTSFEAFEERVHRQLTEQVAVRGERTLGGKEGTRTGWEEGKRPEVVAPRMLELVDSIFSMVGEKGELSDPGEDLNIEEDEDGVS